MVVISIIFIISIISAIIMVNGYEDNRKKFYKSRGLEFKQSISTSKYCGGFEGIASTDLCMVEYVNDYLNIMISNHTPIFNAIRQIKIVDILDTYVETETQIRERVSLGKLALVGVFAFALSSKEHITHSNFVIIKITDKDSYREIVFKPDNSMEFVSQIDKIRGYDRTSELKENNIYM